MDKIKGRQNQAVSELTMELVFYIISLINNATGFRWKFSSWVYNSYSHKTGHAFDLVPDVAPSSLTMYAHNVNSDPVLHNRSELISRLQKVAHNRELQERVYDYDKSVTLIIAIENNHLHIGLYLNTKFKQYLYPNNVRIWKWAVTDKQLAKYKDTPSRQRLKM